MTMLRTIDLRFIFGLTVLLAACKDDEQPADPRACSADVDEPRCADADLELCGPDDQWQTQSCAAACLQVPATRSLGCGFDVKTGDQSCLCVADESPPSVTTADDDDDDDDDDGDSNNDDGDSNDGDGDDSASSSDPGTTHATTDPSGGSDPCSPEYSDCSVNGDCCGYAEDATYCVGNGDGGTCRPVCTADQQCSSGCCAPLDNGDSVCSPANYCDSCVDAGGSCASDQCCSENACVNFGGGDIYCAFKCSYDSECNSGCCAPLAQGGSACVPSNYCSGAPREPLPPFTAGPDETPADPTPHAAPDAVAYGPPR